MAARVREHVGKALQSVQLTRKNVGARLGDNTEHIGQKAIGRRSLALPATNSREEVEVENSETTVQKLDNEQQEQLVKKQDEDTETVTVEVALAGGNKRQRARARRAAKSPSTSSPARPRLPPRGLPPTPGLDAMQVHAAAHASSMHGALPVAFVWEIRARARAAVCCARAM